MNNRRKTLVLIGFAFLVFQVSGQVENNEPAKNKYRKLPYITIEPAIDAEGAPNLKEKDVRYLKLFPKYNGKVEFFYENNFFVGKFGFRIDSLDGNYFLDVRWITNIKEVYEKVGKEFPYVDLNKDFQYTHKNKTGIDSIFKEEGERRKNFNNAQYKKLHQKALEEFEVASKKVQINNDLAEQLYTTLVTLFENYTRKEVLPHPFIIIHSNFRCVVGDEVWNFQTVNPTGAFRELMEICVQIVSDIQEHGELIHEERYIGHLRYLVERELDGKDDFCKIQSIANQFIR